MRPFLGAHLCDLLVREPISLEIGETPPCVAETRSHGRSGPVRLDCLLLPSHAPKGVAESNMKLGGLRRRHQDLAIQRDRLVVSPQPRPCGRRQRKKILLPGSTFNRASIAGRACGYFCWSINTR